MRKIKDILKRIFRRPAIFLVTAWAKRTYREGVEAAERRHKAEGCTVYLARNTFHPDRLATYDKAQFKAEKSIYGYHARLLTMNTLRRGCYYYTSDMFGKNGMTDHDKEVRRRYFIEERLGKAGFSRTTEAQREGGQ